MEKLFWNRCFICSSKLEPEVGVADKDNDEDQSGPAPTAPKSTPPDDKSHEDILLQYLLTLCQRNRIIGKLLYEDIKKLRSASLDNEAVHPTPSSKCVSVQFCIRCEQLAKNLKRFHEQLEVLQIKIIGQLKLMKQKVVNNSRQYGSNNEDVKSYFNKFEQWLNQKETLVEDWESGRKFLQVLQQFQTTVFESTTRICDVPLDRIHKFMDNGRVPPPPPVYNKRQAEEVTDFDSSSEDEEEVSFGPDILQAEVDVTEEDPLKAPETKRDNKLMPERRRIHLVNRLNPQRRKNTRRKLAEQIKKLKMVLQKKTKGIVQPSGEYRVTMDQHSPPPSLNENNQVIEFKEYRPGYKLEVVKTVTGEPQPILKSPKIVTITAAHILARKLRREWMERRKEKKLTKKGQKGQTMCEYCSFKTVGAPKLEQHLRQHETPEKNWNCPDCSKGFTTKQYYELHVIYYCGVELWRCDSCEVAVPRNQISEHLKESHEGSKVYGCEHCDLFYVDFPNLVIHSLLHHAKLLDCQLCPTTPEPVRFATKRGILHHLVEAHHQTKYLVKCDHENCSETCFTSGDLWHHKKIHRIPSFGCSTCGQTFLTKNILQLHIKTRHLKEKPFECSKCSKKFWTRGRREKHLVDEHGIANHKCDICTNVVYSRADSLRYHKQIKHNVGNMPVFQCGVCDKKFYYKATFRDHEKTHSGIKDFTCEICGFCTRTSALLKCHIATHEAVKKYSCEYCQKKFVRKRALKEHHRIHTLERPFQCEICGSTFNQRSALNVHKVKHVEGKSFKPHPTRSLSRRKKAMDLENSEMVGIENSVPIFGNPNVNSVGQEIMSTGAHYYVDSSTATSESTSSYHTMDQPHHQYPPHVTNTTPTNTCAVPSTSADYPIDGTIHFNSHFYS